MKPDVNQENFIKTKRQTFIVPVWADTASCTSGFSISTFPYTSRFLFCFPSPTLFLFFFKSCHSVYQLPAYFLFPFSFLPLLWCLSSPLNHLAAPQPNSTPHCSSPTPSLTFFSSCFHSLFDSIYALNFQCFLAPTLSTFILQPVCTTQYTA